MIERDAGRYYAFMVILAAALMVGCLGSTEVTPANEGALGDVDARQNPNGSSPQPVEPWMLEDEREAGWTAGFGAGGSATGVSECYGLTWDTPDGALAMSLDIGAKIVDEGGSIGVYEVRLYEGENSSKLGPYTEEETLEFEDPATGPWSIELDPFGPVVDQHWSLSVKLDGEGTDGPDWPGLGCIDR